jgi:hypothetical protein
MNTLEQDELDPELDRALRASAPDVTLTGRADEALIRSMVSAARREAALERRPARSRRTVGIAVLLGLGLGGVGAAAAAVTQHQWAPWAPDPATVFTYTLPSGAVCEQRIDVPNGPGSRAAEAMRTYFRTHDVLALADVEGAIASMRSWDEPTEDGASRMSPDTEHQMAVQHAVSDLARDELARQGIDVPDNGLAFLSSESHCPGAQW